MWIQLQKVKLLWAHNVQIKIYYNKWMNMNCHRFMVDNANVKHSAFIVKKDPGVKLRILSIIRILRMTQMTTQINLISVNHLLTYLEEERIRNKSFKWWMMKIKLIYWRKRKIPKIFQNFMIKMNKLKIWKIKLNLTYREWTACLEVILIINI